MAKIKLNSLVSHPDNPWKGIVIKIDSNKLDLGTVVRVVWSDKNNQVVAISDHPMTTVKEYKNG